MARMSLFRLSALFFTLLYVWLEMVHRSLNIAANTKIRPQVDRPVHIMAREALTTAWDWISAEIRHCPVSVRYGRFRRVFGHGSTLRPKTEFENWKFSLLFRLPYWTIDYVRSQSRNMFLERHSTEGQSISRASRHDHRALADADWYSRWCETPCADQPKNNQRQPLNTWLYVIAT